MRNFIRLAIVLMAVLPFSAQARVGTDYTVHMYKAVQTEQPAKHHQQTKQEKSSADSISIDDTLSLISTGG